MDEAFTTAGDRNAAFGGMTDERLRIHLIRPFARWSPIIGVQSGRIMFVDPEARHVSGAGLVRVEPGCNDLYAAYPVMVGGTRVVIEDAEEVFGREVEDVAIRGVVSADDEEPWLGVSFFDTHHVTRGKLKSGPLHAEIGAVALMARRPHENALELALGDLGPEMRSFWDAETEGDTVKLDLSRMRAWLPREGMADLAEFRGPIRSIAPLGPTYLDEPTWRASVEVAASPNGAPFALEMLITASALAGEPAPEQGEAIEGLAWVQGRLL
jgi:hypothetical protein